MEMFPPIVPKMVKIVFAFQACSLDVEAMLHETEIIPKDLGIIDSES